MAYIWLVDIFFGKTDAPDIITVVTSPRHYHVGTSGLGGLSDLVGHHRYVYLPPADTRRPP